jgi:hypothetical protein
LFPSHSTSYCYSNNNNYFGQDLSNFPAFKCKSYYLSNVSNIKPIFITNLSFDENFYDDHQHDEYIPKLVQKSDGLIPPPPFYNNVGEWSSDIGYYYKDKYQNNYQALYDLNYFLVNQDDQKFLLTYKCPISGVEYNGIPWQNADGNDNPLYWNSICGWCHFALSLKNKCPEAQPWVNKPYLFWEFNKCFAATGTPVWCPDGGNENQMWGPHAYANCFCFPPNVNLPVELL